MRVCDLAFITCLSNKGGMSKTKKMFGVATKCSLIVVSLALILGQPSTVGSEEVSVTVISGATPQAGATVTFTNRLTGAVFSTTENRGQGVPAYKADIAPGAYVVTTNSGAESGTMEYTVAPGSNEATVFVQSGGYQNDPRTGGNTTPRGATFISELPAIAQIPNDHPSYAGLDPSGMPITRMRASLSSQYDAHDTNGVNAIPLFTSSIDNGGSLIKADAKTNGFLNEFKVGMGGENPESMAGADRFHFNGGIRHGWGIRKVSIDRLTVPSGQTGDIIGVGPSLSNIPISQADDVSTRSEIDSLIRFRRFRAKI